MFFLFFMHFVKEYDILSSKGIKQQQKLSFWVLHGIKVETLT